MYTKYSHYLLFTDLSLNTDCCSPTYKRTFINNFLCFIRNLPDVSVEDFSKVDLSQYKWVHWEVRVSAKISLTFFIVTVQVQTRHSLFFLLIFVIPQVESWLFYNCIVRAVMLTNKWRWSRGWESITANRKRRPE